ncbi:MAG: hypothetical protein HC837_06660 [Chloroflexaceae bacterium]|nr:hypothetical protein [Chloroflexaceae bacterium]
MAYYTRETLPDQPVLGARRPTINEYFLSSYTMSIYSGCEFACPYCDGWAYNPRSFSDVVRIPLELPKRLKADLMSVDRGDLVSITALSDPYQPVEQNYRLTRHVLQVFAEFGQPCLLLVKGLGVLDDIPLLQKIHERSLAVVMTTLLTVDRHMAERLEGKAPHRPCAWIC